MIKGWASLAILHSRHAGRGNSFFKPGNWKCYGAAKGQTSDHAVYKDRVEIRNPGGLFGGITIADLRKGHVSKRRNPLIADLFRRIEMVEAWGRGMPLILNNVQVSVPICPICPICPKTGS